MYTLMEDPVILPNSKVTIDRATIRSHLLSDPHDPFNRAPLKIEEVVPSKHLIILKNAKSSITDWFAIDMDLKKQIEDFKAERKAAKLQSMKKDVMDTSTGWLHRKDMGHGSIIIIITSEYILRRGRPVSACLIFESPFVLFFFEMIFELHCMS